MRNGALISEGAMICNCLDWGDDSQCEPEIHPTAFQREGAE